MLYFNCRLLFFFNIPNKIALNGSNKYPISLVINPLGNIFAQDEIRGEHAYDDIMIINEILDVQALRKHPSVRNISQYWNIPDTLPKKQLNAFMNASVDLILHNFDTFLYYRYQTFRYTNGMVRDEINHPTPPTTDTIYTLTYYDEDYHNSYYYMKPLFGESLRNRIIDLLSCRHYEKDKASTNALYPVLYNCLPTFFYSTGLYDHLPDPQKICHSRDPFYVRCTACPYFPDSSGNLFHVLFLFLSDRIFPVSLEHL